LVFVVVEYSYFDLSFGFLLVLWENPQDQFVVEFFLPELLNDLTWLECLDNHHQMMLKEVVVVAFAFFQQSVNLMPINMTRIKQEIANQEL
jgi:hypothetical protein